MGSDTLREENYCRLFEVGRTKVDGDEDLEDIEDDEEDNSGDDDDNDMDDFGFSDIMGNDNGSNNDSDDDGDNSNSSSSSSSAPDGEAANDNISTSSNDDDFHPGNCVKIEMSKLLTLDQKILCSSPAIELSLSASWVCKRTLANFMKWLNRKISILCIYIWIKIVCIWTANDSDSSPGDDSGDEIDSMLFELSDTSNGPWNL